MSQGNKSRGAPHHGEGYPQGWSNAWGSWSDSLVLGVTGTLQSGPDFLKSLVLVVVELLIQIVVNGLCKEHACVCVFGRTEITTSLLFRSHLENKY